MTHWILEVDATNGRGLHWYFDEEPTPRTFCDGQVVMYSGTYKGQPVHARIVIASVVAWTTRKDEAEE